MKIWAISTRVNTPAMMMREYLKLSRSRKVRRCCEKRLPLRMFNDGNAMR